MIPSLRKKFNQSFRQQSYDAMMQELDEQYPGTIDFRLAETPVFVPATFASKMYDACDSIIGLIKDESFIRRTDASIPPADKVAGMSRLPEMIAFDFGICTDADGQLVPQLVEMQGFPSLYAFQSVYPDILRRHFDIPANYSQYLGNHDHDTYTRLLKEVILGAYHPHEVVLLEIKPHEQKTRIDFYCTKTLTGIDPVCITELIIEDRNVYYLRNGTKTQIRRIYNRVIFDELHARKDLGALPDITKPLNVEWVPHPDWFYRISKYTLPFIHHPFVPQTFFLHEIKQPPPDLENYVLKPLFSFAGQGVVIDVRRDDLGNIGDPENWILQKKVMYAPVIETPGTPAKAEVRIMYLWEPGAPSPEPVINLARLSKGKMIGTRYNKNMDWVGGSVAYFEKGV